MHNAKCIYAQMEHEVLFWSSAALFALDSEDDTISSLVQQRYSELDQTQWILSVLLTNSLIFITLIVKDWKII